MEGMERKRKLDGRGRKGAIDLKTDNPPLSPFRKGGSSNLT